ncbi:NEAT domain-containing protein [Oceanobacillus alkalisoli]|uniref:NEAT domain-containing protein n=1 Tax=Oceanobacillus alkalisoli TaxID=2925113 RepID=UPI001EEFBD8D|nr:NEAT domain-containing protein [Oceanobacillus alkalisoli]MCF3943391.1 NEAT domain-containing protein [Oceanobacillus alkalisoli]MCG5103980.1 NEAT domain-containing protein [Oceanobacillus alkalisoli]
MRKWFLALIVALLALPLFGTSVFAEEEVVYEDGEYTINAVALKKDSDDPSGAAGFIDEKAVLKIVDGKATLVITVPHNEMAEVTGIQIEGIEATVTEDDAARSMAFPLETVKAELHAQVQYEVPAIGMKGDEPFRFILERLDEIPVVEEEPEEDPTPEQPEDPAEPEEPAEQPEEEPTEPEQPTEPEDENEADEEEKVDSEFTPEEAYTITYESDIALDRYFHNPAALLYKDGKTYIQIVGNMGQFIDYLTINGEKVTLSNVDNNDHYIAQFEVTSLDATYELGMYIDTPMGYMEHTAEISFVEDTKQEVDVDNYTLLAPEQGEKPEEKPEEKAPEEDEDKEETPKEDEDKNKEKPTKPENPANDDKDNKETPKAPKKDDGLVPDKAYEINYEIKHETEDRPSAADSFFVKPAILLEKDGVYYLQITVNGSEYINSIKNEFGEFVFVRENMDGSVVYQLKIDGKLTDEIMLDMLLTVPGVYENQAHSARLILDPSSMKAIDASNYLLVASTNENGPDAENAQDPEENADVAPEEDNIKPGGNKPGNNKLDPNTPEKPQFGNSDNNGGKSTNTNTNSSGLNPKTGEETNVMLYMLLLIASAIPLAVQLKRRFV